MATTFEERLTALEKENTEIKRRLSTVEGQFEYISGQLRDLKLYTHARFEQVDRQIKDMRSEIDARFKAMDKRFDEIPGIVRDVMRDVLAESRTSSS